MGLFGRNKKEEIVKEDVPQLSMLPKLPEFPSLDEELTRIHSLPSFPSNTLGTRLSQNTIKDAVLGNEEESSNENADDEENMSIMREPLKKPVTEEMGEKRFPSRLLREAPQESFPSKLSNGMSQEPVFIRVDKFEGAIAVFNETRRKMSEIELALEEIKKVRDKEDRELQSWESEIRSMKDKIEKVDRAIFSKI